MYRSFGSLFFLACCYSHAGAQQDTVVNKFVPTAIFAGADLIGEIRTRASETFTGHEWTVGFESYRYLPCFEFGKWTRQTMDSPASYGSDGRFFRAGLDVNFLLFDPEHNVFFLGGRYGRSSFSDHVSFASTDAVWGDSTLVRYDNNVSARWYELTTGIKVKLWEWLWMGYTARYRFSLKIPDELNVHPYEVPGYGRTFRPFEWGFTYYILVRLPVRNNPGALKANPGR